MFKKAAADKTGRWEAFHFTSHANPHISVEALREITNDMTALAIKQEIEAEDIDEVPGALWSRNVIEDTRLSEAPDCGRIVIGVDPQGRKKDNAETGIIPCGFRRNEGYVLGDYSINGTPKEWGKRVVSAYYDLEADRVVAEGNFGGEMVREVIHSIDPEVPVKLVNASRGKLIRAEPISARWERGECHLVGIYPQLEDEMCSYTSESGWSPNRLDAMVWGMTELLLKGQSSPRKPFEVVSREATKIY
jgi:phage terminase large subunit-like protein